MTLIVVGVDGTPAGDAALYWSLREAARSGARVKAVTAWHPDDYSWYAAGLSEQTLSDEEPRSTLEAAVARVTKLADHDSVEVSTHVGRGSAAFVLEQEAQSADLLVVGRRHEVGLARAALGSVSSAALHHAPCPIAVVPGAWEPPAEAGRVLVGVDGSAAAAAALSWAAQRAARDQRLLVPVRVRAAFEDALDAPEGVPSIRDLESAEIAHLARLSARAAGDAQLRVAPEVRIGHAGRELVDAAGPDDELVVGSRARGRLRGWLLGSTSAHAVHHAHAPVVVVRESGGG